jgi:hypothetical protein
VADVVGSATNKTDAKTDADLARVLAAWPSLAAPIKAAILALVNTPSTPGT